MKHRQDRLSGEIMAAVLTIISREGFEGVTIRRVAAEAGCSAGAVQKRFPKRSQLLRSALGLVVASSLERIEAVESAPAAGTLRELVRQGARETLPLDAERRTEGLVWTSYLLRASVDESLSDLPRRVDQAVHDALKRDLIEAREAGALRPGADPDHLADALLALIDGFAIRMLYTPPAGHEDLLDAMDAGLEALLR